MIAMQEVSDDKIPSKTSILFRFVVATSSIVIQCVVILAIVLFNFVRLITLLLAMNLFNSVIYLE